MEIVSSLIKALNLDKWPGTALRWLRRPKLELHFDPEQTYQTARLLDQNGALAYFCHLVVSNKGRETAKNCRGRLIQISIRDQDGNTRRDKDFGNPAVLKWAHESDYGPRDIEPEINKRLDLCYAAESFPHELVFFTPQLPNGNRTVYPPGRYQVKIRVDADNASYVIGDFAIDFGGVWNEIKVSEAHNLSL